METLTKIIVCPHCKKEHSYVVSEPEKGLTHTQLFICKSCHGEFQAKVSYTIDGFKTYRHESNPKEKELHDKFLKEYINGDSVRNVDILIFPTSNPSQTIAIDTLSDREKQIMLSTIQWLGSHVGQSFLRDCGFELKSE